MAKAPTKSTMPAANTRRLKKTALSPELYEILNRQLTYSIWPYLNEEASKAKYDEAKRHIAETKLNNAWQHLLPEKYYRVFRLNLAEIDAADVALQNMKPKDAIEGMLATQMVSVHYAMMQCMHLAATATITTTDDYNERDEYLRHAVKLSKAFASLVNVFNSKRNKGKIKQEITVQHIHLEGGAQAVIGGKDNLQREGGLKK